MRVERIVREIELFINKTLGNCFDLDTDIVIDDDFRCVCITNNSIPEIPKDIISSFLSMLYVDYGAYISDIMDVISGRMFNIYLYDDHHIRT